MADLLVFLPLAGVLVATGCIAGILAGLLGVGGGIVVVPVLFTLLGWSASICRFACTLPSARRSPVSF